MRLKEGIASAMATWQDLEAELAVWAAAEREPVFWWRDDDGEAPSPELENLLELRRSLAIPVALALIPATVRTVLAARLSNESDDVVVLQHGYEHANHSPSGAKKAELAPGRSRVGVIAQLTEGRHRLEALFGQRFRAVLVPPWNRIDPDLVSLLPAAGFVGLSVFAGRHRPPAVPGLRRADCHIDVIDWHGSRRFIGVEAALDAALSALKTAYRHRLAEAIGVLTHHLIMDPDAWAFVRDFVERIGARRRGHWIGINQALIAAP